LERHGSNLEIKGNAVHYDYYVSEGRQKPFATL
jgi:hypothetical protein